MTGVSVLLAEVRAAGVQLGLEGGKLRIKVPRGVLTATQRDQLVTHRAEIAALLAEPANDRDMSRTVPVCPAVPVDSLPASLKVAFQERAAIAEVDGGLDRAAAERLAWDEVNAGPIGDTLQAWRAWMNYRLQRWTARGLSREDAKRSMWSEAESKWHRRHGAPPDPDRCAGCGEWMLDGPGMRMLDGAVVHFGNPDRLDCLIIYGEAWRTAASAGLMALGLRKPE
jgi:TubC N-terminal docking domain